MSKILEVKHLKKNFGEKKVLDDINFSLNVGECLGIVGRSGCGNRRLQESFQDLSTLTAVKLFLTMKKLQIQKIFVKSIKKCK